MKQKFKFKLVPKIILFTILYSLFFYFFRNSSYYNYRLLIASIDSIPWFYSTIGLIFGMISAFIIQKEWQQWNDLVDSVKNEKNALYQMWLWSERLPELIKLKIRESVKNYLKTILNDGWEKTEEGEVSNELDESLRNMYDATSDLSVAQPVLSSITFSLAGNIMNYREKRLRFGSSHMPKILLNTFRMSTVMMVVLCPLIAVKNFELHFIFSVCIAILSFTIYLVIRDMDNPLKPGNWHISTRDYRILLDKLEK